MKHCELCKGLARTYCESDDASLCWNCDVKVHGANFLVARHSRSVLCHACQSPTPWKASGTELGVTVTVCETCVAAGRNAGREREEEEEEEGESREGNDLEEIDSDNDEEEEEEEDDENQVVPWTSSAPETPPPPASSSSSQEDESWSGNGGGDASPRKRSREVSSNRTDQDYIDCCSAKRRCCAESAIRPDLARAGPVGPIRSGSRTNSVIGSPEKIRSQDLRNLRRGDSVAVDP